ncbi:MAG: 5'/3'-nucleotidase SurE [Clostridiales bacterium]|nr:5'/3'-nucleotidase SurE [Clostridiales bacterium]
MNILLTNDDGFDSPGIRILAKRLSSQASLWACIPREQQSATGHGISVREVLHVREEHMEGVQRAWSVDGKPVDCVKLAFLSLLTEPVDLVISGINEGTNLGTDTLYSGTVAGAMEGALNGAPAIALSLAAGSQEGEEWRFEEAAQVCLTLIRKWEAGLLPIPPMTILNVNVPDLPADQCKGFKAAKLGVQRYSDIYERLEENSSGCSYRLKGERLPSYDRDAGLDIVALSEGYVTITPLSANRTDTALLNGVSQCLLSI